MPILMSMNIIEKINNIIDVRVGDYVSFIGDRYEDDDGYMHWGGEFEDQIGKIVDIHYHDLQTTQISVSWSMPINIIISYEPHSLAALRVQKKMMIQKNTIYDGIANTILPYVNNTVIFKPKNKPQRIMNQLVHNKVLVKDKVKDDKLELNLDRMRGIFNI